MIFITKDTYKEIVNFIKMKKSRVYILKMTNKVLTLLVYFLYPLLLLLLIYQRDIRFWRVLLVPLVSFILVSIFRRKFNASRPYEVLDIVPVLDKNTSGKSFPSRHVFSVFVISMAFHYICPLMGIGLMIVGFLLAVVRVMGGVHYPKDVIAGAVLGILSGLVGFYFV